MPSITCVLRFLYAVFLTLPTTAATKWDPNYHPNQRGGKHPKGSLPDWPPELPDWLTANLTCYPTYDYIRDAHAINVLYVANRFCHEIGERFRRGRRNRPWPVYEIERYDTNRYYQVIEGSSKDNLFKVEVQDTGVDCTPRWAGEGANAGENPDGFATSTMPDLSEISNYTDILHPYGGANDNLNLCVQILYNTWRQCDRNEGRGGELTVEPGCLKYSIEPYEGQNYLDQSCPESCVCPLYANRSDKIASFVEKDNRYMIPGTAEWVNLDVGRPSHP